MEEKNQYVLVIERACIFLIVIALGYIGFSIFSGHKELKEGVFQGDPGQLKYELADEKILTGKPYEPAVKERNLWGALDKIVVEDKAPAVSVQSHELPSNLKIVAILIGNPSEVAIEDALLQKTTLIPEGEMRAGIKVEHIEAGRILLNYQGQNIEVISRR